MTAFKAIIYIGTLLWCLMSTAEAAKKKTQHEFNVDEVNSFFEDSAFHFSNGINHFRRIVGCSMSKVITQTMQSV
jgi:hypothetical protein